MNLHDALDARVTERALQENVRRLAKIRGYLYYHTHRSQHSPAGFPDCVFIKDGRLLVAELKRQRTKPTPDQQAWLDGFTDCGVPTYLWRPSDWRDGTIEAVLC